MNNEYVKIMEKINGNKYVKKTKKSLLSLVFSRAGVFILLILLQIGFMIYLYHYINIDVSLLIGGDTVLRIVIMLIILNMDSINPSYKNSWFILIAIFPSLSTAVFLLDHLSVGYKKEQKRVLDLEKVSRKLYNRDLSLVYELKENDKDLYNYQNYFYDLGGFVTYDKTSTKYYPVGEDVFADIIKAIRGAKDFIFIEIFIISYGYMWGTILEELVKKVEEGVEVRLLFDGTNSLVRVKSNFVEEMNSLGIKCKVFSPMIPIVSTYYNNRDHRKIFVIDNEYAFTGGINLADEYINVYERFGHWKDCGLRLKGAAVESLTLMFLQMWSDSPEEVDTFARYLPRKSDPDGAGLCIPFSDSPMDDEYFAKNSILTMLNNSTDYVYFMTPYLILEDEIINAITNATKRGVDVRICMPHIPDKKIAFALAKSHYVHLISNGVRIYEYTPGFCHSKVWLSDDSSAFVGTINLDYRALYLNFECGVWMKDTSAIGQIKEDFDVFFSIGSPISLEDAQNRPLITKAVGYVAKPFATLF
ncbi:cardiolipin synthase [Anaerococcus provencensis]|uniref:cardiolipin synthase n=1 Tax=Anaerococcus provencensis TaxID=938293 RepID=UPI0002E1870B|nr:cardiolipin synthase [Anaerococcus provencensis]